jgi:hypothetical protein
MRRTPTHYRIIAALTLSAALVSACTDDSPSDPSVVIDAGVDADGAEDAGGGADAGEDVGVEDAGEGDAGEEDAGEPDLCDPNPCTEANRSVCEPRGAVVVCGCDDGYRDEDGACVEDLVCDANACVEPNRGVCTDSNGVAVCGCDEGYVERDGQCVVEDPCALDPCTEPNRGVCSVGANQTAVCGCDEGYVDDSGQCVPEDPCALDPCQEPNRGVCVADGLTATCACDAGFREDGQGACVDADVCDPNPCNGPNKTTCVTDAQGAAACQCDQGYQDDGAGGCVVVPPPTCANQHTTGDSYEPDECVALATPIAPGDTQSHTIEPAGDRDFYLLTPQAGEILRFEESTGMDSYWVLYDTDGSTVLRATDNEGWNWEFATAGPYYVMGRHYSSTRTGSYELSVTSLGFDDHGDTYDVATPITLASSPVSGNTETRGDLDYFAFTAEAGHVYRFSDTSTRDMYFVLYDTDGTTALRATDNESWRWEFDAAGTYYIRARHYSSTSVGQYELEIEDLGFDDHGDTYDLATPITAASSPVAGSTETRGDLDYFAFTAQAGHIYEFADTSTRDMYFVLYDTDGTTALRATDNESWRWEFDAAGTYYIRVRHYSSTSVGDYSIEITDLGLDDHGDTYDVASPWAPGQTIAGSIETRGDRDVFAFTAQAGHVYRMEETTSLDGYLTLRDGAGNALRITDTEWIQWEFPAAGSYTLELRHYSSTRIGDYSVTLTDLGPDDGGDSPAEATPSGGPGVIVGAIETYQDRDVYSFTTTLADQIFYVGEETGTDVTLTLYDTDGVTVLETASSPEWFARQFASPGTYFVSVRHGSSTRIGGYELLIEDRGLDDHANGPTMATAIAPDGSSNAGELEYRGDTDWFTFTTTAGNVYGIEIAGNSRWRATLYAADGATVIDSVTNATMFPTLDAATTYHVEVETTSSNTLGSYTLSVDD